MAAPAGIDHDWAVRSGGILMKGQGRAMLRPLLRTIARTPGQRLRLVTKRRGSGGIDLGTHELDPACDAVLRRHPRLEFKKHVRAAWKAECEAVPGGRANWLRVYATFPLLVRLAPFDE